MMVEKVSVRQICRDYGLSHHTVAKMLENVEPPGYQQGEVERPRPKLGQRSHERAAVMLSVNADVVELLIRARNEGPVELFSLDGHAHFAGVSLEALNLSAYVTLTRIMETPRSRSRVRNFRIRRHCYDDQSGGAQFDSENKGLARQIATLEEGRPLHAHSIGWPNCSRASTSGLMGRSNTWRKSDVDQ